MNPRLFPIRLASVALAIALALSACAEKDPQAILASAQQYLENGDTSAAIIQLKNALQEKPDLSKARFLLGKALLSSGDVVGGETELQKARDLGYAADDVTPLLVRARLAQGQFRSVTDEFSKVQLTSAESNAELMTLVAVAWKQQGDDKAYEAALKAALQSLPDHAPALIEKARLTAAQSDFSGALGVLESVLAKDIKNADALKLRGDILLYGLGDAAQALAAYRGSVEARPGFQDGQAAVIRTLMGQGNTDEAEAEVAKLVGFAGGQPQTLYLQSQLAYQKGDYKVAQTHTQQLLKLTPDSPIGLELAGSIEFQLNSMVQAERLLARAVQTAPQLSVARRFLVLTYLRTGQVDRAIGALPLDIESNDSDPAMLAVAGRAYMVKGDVEKAQQLFVRSAKLDPKDPFKRTSVAVTQLLQGKSEVALAALQEIASSDEGVVADLALINAHMQRREVDKALAAIDSLEKKRANDPMPWQLRGRALLVKRDFAGARKAFEQAERIAPEYFAATAALAALDIAEGKASDAQIRLDETLKRKPNNAQALMAQAEILSRTGGTKEDIAGKIQKAVEAAPNDKAPRLMLMDHYLRQNDPKAALAAAQAAVATLPESPELIDALGRAQTASGEYNQALSSFGKLQGLLPQSPLPFLRMAMAQSASGDKSAAIVSLRKALDVQPDLLEAQRGIAMLALQSNLPSEALAMGRSVQKQRPKEDVGYLLEGDVHAAAKMWDLAVNAYRAGLKIAPSSELAIKLHTALTRGGKAAEADRFAADWQKGHPKDAALSLYLGDQAIATGKLEDAQRLYERAIGLQPTNAAALNNLAWVAGQLGRVDAIELAVKANEAAPNQPAFMDTLAMLLSSKGEHARALDLQKKATAMAPNAPLFKLNLAKIQLAAGQKDAARTTLNELSALGGKFASQAEVDRLKKGL